MQYDFFSDSITAKISIQKDNSVFGEIGMASFINGTLSNNKGSYDITGISHLVKCSKIGKIFPEDMNLEKEVELWLSPIGDNIKVEIRLNP